MADISIQDLTKRYETPGGSELAVDSVNLEIKHNEFVTFVGPSGCGKTTLLNMISGLVDPTNGHIFFDEEEVTNLPPQQRNISMVFQDPVLYPHMTNRENISYGLRVRGETENLEEKVMETATLLNISELLDKKPGQLSGGQRQRVALGRAIIREPHAILFDEPMSDLDAKLKADLRVQLQKLHREIDSTMIYVTHDQKEAMTLSDRIAVMNNGSIVQIDKPDELFNSPNSRFVGEFIGEPSMNILQGSVKNGSVYIGENKLFDINNISYDKRTVYIGFRPQDISLSDEYNGTLFNATVEVWETLGSEYVLYLNGDDNNELIAITEDSSILQEKSKLGVDKIDTVYIFDRDSTENIAELKNIE